MPAAERPAAVSRVELEEAAARDAPAAMPPDPTRPGVDTVGASMPPAPAPAPAPPPAPALPPPAPPPAPPPSFREPMAAERPPSTSRVEEPRLLGEAVKGGGEAGSAVGAHAKGSRDDTQNRDRHDREHSQAHRPPSKPSHTRQVPSQNLWAGYHAWPKRSVPMEGRGRGIGGGGCLGGGEWGGDKRAQGAVGKHVRTSTHSVR